MLCTFYLIDIQQFIPLFGWILCKYIENRQALNFNIKLATKLSICECTKKLH